MNKWVWIGSITVFGLFVYLTHGVMLPFLMGLAVAYFLDPVADRLEAWGAPRGAAAALVITFFFLLIVGVVLAFWPVLQAQIVSASTTLPKTVAGLRPLLNDMMQSLSNQFGADVASDVDSMLEGFTTSLFDTVKGAAAGVLSSSLAVFNILSLLILSPVVAFYLLRDWDLIVAKVNGWLPPAHAPVIREQMGKIDMVLAGFVRGQMLVSTAMGVLYGVGWALVGLDFAVVLGVLAGVMSIIPFAGAVFAAVVAIAMAIGQFGFDITQIALVGSVFLVVQAIESAVLTPRLLGDRVGLHPVWVLFAVFAGGEVMGFVGVLIAVPATAAIAVLVRYWIDVYLDHYEITNGEPAQPPVVSEEKAAKDGQSG